MNSEELEQSLRTEFENYLKQVSADMRQDVTEFQQKIETEVERHKSQLAEVFQDFSARTQKDIALDAGFKDSVTEHLRLARDEGASITATAFAEAEEMAKESASAAVPSAGISELRDGINDISSQTSQALILKALVQHAGQFTARGAFFIIKNEHFVGWRVFGKETETQSEAEAAVREVFFPLSADTTLGEAVKSLNAVKGAYGKHAGDSVFLDKLQFGAPEKMFAIPLVARGRGVAVLYADYGTKGEEANIEALETLVRVAGLTVEVMAASTGTARPASAHQTTTPTAAAPNTTAQNQAVDFGHHSDFDARDEYQTPESKKFEEPQVSAENESSFTAEPSQTDVQTDYQYPVENDDLSAQNRFQPETVNEPEAAPSNYAPPQDYSTDDYAVEEVEMIEDEPAQVEQSEPENYSWNQPEASGNFTQNYQPQPEGKSETEAYPSDVAAESDYSAAAKDEYPIEADQSFETPQFGNSSYDSAPSYSPVKEEAKDSFESPNGTPAESFDYKPAETVAEPAAAAKPVRSRFSDKNVDLPIEVSEDERRLHNDARRFARLLVSEIKLYNEQKVKEGREAGDLYERLREAIDRSREMYDKRIQPPVAAKFDYFHYELVNTLADGDEAKLGADYPGAAV